MPYAGYACHDCDVYYALSAAMPFAASPPRRFCRREAFRRLMLLDYDADVTMFSLMFFAMR